MSRNRNMANPENCVLKGDYSRCCFEIASRDTKHVLLIFIVDGRTNNPNPLSALRLFLSCPLNKTVSDVWLTY